MIGVVPNSSKGSFTRTVSVSVSVKLFIIVSIETGRLLAEWVRNPFCKKTACLHLHNDNNLTEMVRVNEP